MKGSSPYLWRLIIQSFMDDAGFSDRWENAECWSWWVHIPWMPHPPSSTMSPKVTIYTYNDLTNGICMETFRYTTHMFENLVICMVLYYCSPKSMFIMGGGEGSTAREAIKHKSIEKVIMCDIDQVIN